MAASDKDTIYIDIDDEITGIIDKLKASQGKVVALVLPKRAAVFQSIVNMKLLKRAADGANKHLVLITSEAGLLPLAGAADVHVAKTLTSKPEIPAGPLEEPETDEAVAEDELPDEDAAPDSSKSVGELAGPAAAADGVETLVMDDEDLPPEDAAAAGAPVAKDFKPPVKDKKLKIPDFDRFRLLLIGGGLLLLLLIFGFIFANSVFPKATISIQTDATAVDATADLNLSTAAKTLSEQDNTLPAKLASTQKTYSQAVPTTGQKNNGNKASGNVTVNNCGDDNSIPEGAGLSSGGNTYIAQSAVDVPASHYNNHGACLKDKPVTVPVLAQSGGTSYNLPSGANFAVNIPGGSSLSGQGGTISGGTDNIVRTVNQNDINSAKSKITVNDNDLKTTLSDSLKKDNLYALVATYSAGTPAVTSSANVGDVADNVTVTENVTYTMFGVHKKDLETIIDNAIKTQIDTSKQSILDNGLDKATYNVDSQSATDAKLSVGVNATAGPDLDVNAIKQDAAGKKPGAIKDQLKTNPDVTDVQVHLSPFWVGSVPKNTSKIKVVIAKPQAKASSSNGGQ